MAWRFLKGRVRCPQRHYIINFVLNRTEHPLSTLHAPCHALCILRPLSHAPGKWDMDMDMDFDDIGSAHMLKCLGLFPGLRFRMRPRVSYVIRNWFVLCVQTFNRIHGESWRWQYPHVRCGRIITSVGWKQGFTQIRSFLVTRCSIVSLWKWKDRYEWASL